MENNIILGRSTVATRRVEWLDIMKGFLIILVVVGHLDLSLDISKNVSGVIYHKLFHMPLFMILTGYTTRFAYFDEHGQRIKGSIVRQIANSYIVYLIFSTIYILFKVAASKSENTDLSITNLLTMFVSPVSHFWYIFVLIMFYILYKFSASYISRSLQSILICVVAFGIKVLWSMHGIETIKMLDLAISWFPFWQLGIVIRGLEIKIDRKRFLCVMSVVEILLVVALLIVNLCVVDFYQLSIHSIVSALLVGIPLFAFFMCGSEHLPSGIKRVFIIFGKNCLPIYLIHSYFTFAVAKACLYVPSSVSDSLVYVIASIIALASTCIVAVIIQRYLPILFKPIKKRQ